MLFEQVIIHLASSARVGWWNGR